MAFSFDHHCAVLPALRTDHAAFLRDVAAIDPPPLLSALIRVLQAQGEQPVSPADRRGMVPLAVPLTRNPATVPAVAPPLRAPSNRPPTFVMSPSPPCPPLRSPRHGDGAAPLAHRSPGGRNADSPCALSTSACRCPLSAWERAAAASWLHDRVSGVSAMRFKGSYHSRLLPWFSHSLRSSLSPYTRPPQADEYIQRALVEEDVGAREGSAEGDSGRVGEAAGEEGRRLYSPGDFAAAKAKSLDAYLTTKVGMFPDVLERLALRHLEQGDQVSALVAGEFYARKHFPGFAHPFTFNAQLLLRVGRPTEARDAARIALKSPWWTLGASYQEVAELAGYGDSQLEYALERLTEEGRKEDVNKGKAEAQ
ncbi:unnamed protein product, partial [Closterium sp. Naga37s-1]